MPKIKTQQFIWDKGNQNKNLLRHRITNDECEQVFFDKDKNEYPDPKHSIKEIRKIVVGKTKLNRNLFIVYTMSKNNIRIISARDINKKERKLL